MNKTLKTLNNMKVNINGVSITPTEEQLQQIHKQCNNKSEYSHYTDIKTFEDALEYLKYSKDFNYSIVEKIQLVAKAINTLNNVKVEYNWYPIFNTNKSGLGWSFASCSAWFSFAIGSVCYLKDKQSCNYMGTQFSHLFKEHYGSISLI